MADKFYKLDQNLAARRDLSANAKILFAIIKNRIGTGEKCWPGVRRLSRESGSDHKTVLRSIDQLERAGCLVVQRQSAGQTNWYSLSKTAPETPALPKKERSQKGSAGGPKKGAEALPKREHIKIKKRTINKNQAFEDFWRLYPRKQAKAKAQDAWDKLNPDSDLVQTILAAVKQHSRSDQWLNEGGKYVLGAARWLTEQRWTDELETADNDTGLVETRNFNEIDPDRQAAILKDLGWEA